MHNPNVSTDKASPVKLVKRKPNQSVKMVLGLSESLARNNRPSLLRETGADADKAALTSMKFKGIVLSHKLLRTSEASQQKEQSLSRHHVSSSKKKQPKRPAHKLLPSHNLSLSPRNPHTSQDMKPIEKCSTEANLPGAIGLLIHSNKRNERLTAKEHQFIKKMDKYSRNRSASRKEAGQPPAFASACLRGQRGDPGPRRR